MNEKIDIFIDDSITNCTAVSQKGMMTLLFTSKWNEKLIVPFQRVQSWEEIYDLISKNLSYKKEDKE